MRKLCKSAVGRGRHCQWKLDKLHQLCCRYHIHLYIVLDWSYPFWVSASPSTHQCSPAGSHEAPVRRERSFGWRRRSGYRRGQALVEFAMTSIIVLMLLFAVVEFGRIVMVYTTVADAARIGARYAITNSSVPGQSAIA